MSWYLRWLDSSDYLAQRDSADTAAAGIDKFSIHATILSRSQSHTKMTEKPHIRLMRKIQRYGPQGFSRDLDTHSKVKIAHNIAFQVYRFENFEHLWSREWVVEEPELNLAVRWLRKDLDSTKARSRAEAMLRVWWYFHDIEGCEFSLIRILDEAWQLTAPFREMYESRKADARVPKAPDYIEDYLSKHTTASAAEMERDTGIDRKTLNQALGRLCKSGKVVRVSRGVYQLRGDKWWL